MGRKKEYIIRIKTDKRIDLTVLQKALDQIDKEFELVSFERYKPYLPM